MYLDAYYSGAEFPGGLSFRRALGQFSLDGIVSRLFDEHVTKSVRASAEANSMPQPRNHSPGR